MAEGTLTPDGWIYPCHTRGPKPRWVWRMRDDGLEESVLFRPGHNCSDDSMAGHGVHDMEIWWFLRGPAGAAQFELFTGWTPGIVRPGHGIAPDRTVHLRSDGRLYWPAAYRMGCHARKAPEPDTEPMSDKCSALDGAACWWVDAGYSAADELVPQFVDTGEQVVWDQLEELYAKLAG